MSMLSTLLKSADRAPRSSGARIVALVLAVATPLLVAGVAVLALQNAPTGSSGTPDLPAAVVNLDTPITATIGGTATPVAAGKLLTSQLVGGQAGSGFSWTITDADDARSGLESGAYSAVVTIPSNFSALYVSISSDGATPTAAPLQVETNGGQSYVADLLASALATNVHDVLATSLTQGYVTGLLGGLTSIHDQLTTVAGKAGELATGAGQVSQLGAGVASGVDQVDTNMQKLSGGLAEAASSTAKLPELTKGLNDLAVASRDGSGLITAGLKDTASKQKDIETKQAALNASISKLSTDLPTLSPAEVQARLADIQKASDDIALSSLGIGVALDVGTVASGALTEGTTLVAKGTTGLADSTPALATGLSDAAGGAAQLATGTTDLNGYASQLAQGTTGIATGVTQLSTGLTSAAGKIPSYTADQQKTLSAVATNPVVTTVSDTQALPTAQVATASVMVPVGLWIGAFALYLLLTPFTVQALASSASGGRVLRQSLLPALALAVVQALVVIVGLQLIGLGSANPLGGALFILGLSVAFVAMHQGLVALFGRIGRLISLTFLVLQVAAAGVLVPAALSPDWFQTVSSFLPVSAGVRGMQALLTGSGSAGALVGGAVIVLLVVAGLGIAFTLIAISRRRSVTSLS
ncbi:hypothetical protein C5B96_01935 [Subtercola sp. Z020]|uniref:YhgE/Pip family protein n=1 Tax=Subtercola sp. Z020 TaxID=2080582 RepID=UPI000CE78017|nr:YhgE/Pip family protein [Subtercola sp. Z020]PPF89003.1 hypothetical protein C5B96_01935 [Subtercola sp. Z020]